MEKKEIKELYLNGKIELKTKYIPPEILDDEAFILDLMGELIKNQRINEYDNLRFELGEKMNNLSFGKKLRDKFLENSLIALYFTELSERLINFMRLSDVASHPNLKGNPREGIISILLKEILPDMIDYKTGQVADVRGRLSKQVDIILEDKYAPKMTILKDVQISFWDYILCAIEVKSTMDKSTLYESLDNFCILKGMEGIKSHQDRFCFNIRTIYGSIDNTLGSEIYGIPTLLIAYKSKWKTVKTILNNLEEYINDKKIDDSRKVLPEVIVIIEKKLILVRNNGWLIPVKNTNAKYISYAENDYLSILFMYLNNLIEDNKRVFDKHDIYRYLLKEYSFIKDYVKEVEEKSNGR